MKTFSNAAAGDVVLSMAERIVELEKPAHTWFDIREYWNMFRVGEARLGLDTRIGHSTFFQHLVLGDATEAQHEGAGHELMAGP